MLLLTDEEYAAGIARIHAAIVQAESDHDEVAFTVDISLQMVAGYLGGNKELKSIT